MANEGSDLSRRNILLAAGGAALGGYNLTVSAAMPSGGLDGGPRPSTLKPAPDELRAKVAASTWSKQKKYLLTLPDFSWLAPLAGDLPVDQIVYEATSTLANVVPPYDPYQLDSLTASASALLDRCLTYRREMYDLEERAVRRALEYNLFNTQYPAQIAIELQDRIESQRQAERDGQLAGSQAFMAATASNPLAAGFASVTGAGAQSAAIAVTSEQERKANVRAKWSALKEYQAALQARHSTPGHSLNYGERFDRLKSFLQQDIQVAYQKVRCIQLAAMEIFGSSLTSDMALDSIEKPFQYGYLDYLVMFVRSATDAIERATVREVNFETVVSLRRNMSVNGDTFQVVSAADWYGPISARDTEDATGYYTYHPLTFSLQKLFPQSIFKQLRVRGIALSCMLDVPFPSEQQVNAKDQFQMALDQFSGQEMSNVSISAKLFPPQQSSLLSNGSVDSPPMVFGNIPQYDPRNVPSYQSPSVANINPAKGAWYMQIDWPYFQFNASDLAGVGILDVLLHLRLSAVLDTNASNWTSSVPGPA